MVKKNVIAIIPARGGSKGLPRKNIRLLAGQPLIAYAIKTALKSNYLKRIIVSTDNMKIASIAKKYGSEVILRPRKLACDKSPVLDSLKHVLDVLKRDENYIPDIVVLLHTTTPLRSARTIDLAIKTFIKKYHNYDSLVPLFPEEVKLGKIRRGYYKPNYKLGSRRQDLEKIYCECGTIFIFKSKLIIKNNAFGKRILPFVIRNYKESIDIDTINDLRVAEYFV